MCVPCGVRNQHVLCCPRSPWLKLTKIIMHTCPKMVRTRRPCAPPKPLFNAFLNPVDAGQRRGVRSVVCGRAELQRGSRPSAARRVRAAMSRTDTGCAASRCSTTQSTTACPRCKSARSARLSARSLCVSMTYSRPRTDPAHVRTRRASSSSATMLLFMGSCPVLAFGFQGLGLWVSLPGFGWLGSCT